MMAAAGAAAPEAGFLHLFAHGVFKALLFLGAGVGDPRVPHQRRVPHGRAARDGRGRGCRSWSARWPWPASGRCPASSRRRRSSPACCDGASDAAVPDAGAHRVPDRLLHVPRRVPGLLRPAPSSARHTPHVPWLMDCGVPAAGRPHAGDRRCASAFFGEHAARGRAGCPRSRWRWPARRHRAGVGDVPARRDRSGPGRRRAAADRLPWRGGATASTRSSPASTAGAARLRAPGRLDRSLPGGRRPQRAERVDAAGGRPAAPPADRASPRTTSTAWRSACCCSSCWRSGA